MEDKRFINYVKSKHNYNQFNYLISNYFKSDLENEQKINQLVKSISKINSSVKNPFYKKINANSIKKNNIDSPSFGCKKTKSVDDINRKKLIINDNIPINSNNNSIKCYKRPRHYVYNKSVDIIKNKDKYGCKNQEKKENINNYNNNKNKYISNYISTKKRKSSNFERINSFRQIFTKIPTNISRIKKNNDSFEQSLDYSLLNNNINNSNNYFSVNSKNENYLDNNSFLYNNNTFYDEKNLSNLSIEMAKNQNYKYKLNENSINDSIINYNKEDSQKRIYYKTPIQRTKLKHNKRYGRNISEDYYTNKRIKEDYFNTASTNSLSNKNANNNQLYNKRLSDKLTQNLTPKNYYYKDYLIVYNSIKNKIKNNNINKKNLSMKEKIELTKPNIFKHKKLSSYILRNHNKRKDIAKSYDNTIFKEKIKLVKRKKRPKRKRNNTFDEIILDKPYATPIKKENDKGGKIDLTYERKYNTLNRSNIIKKSINSGIIKEEDSNHKIIINIKNIKNNLNKIILIQKWWKNILQNKIKKVNNKFNKYKLNQKSTKNSNDTFNFNSKKRYLNRNKYNSLEINKLEKEKFINKNELIINAFVLIRY